MKKRNACLGVRFVAVQTTIGHFVTAPLMLSTITLVVLNTFHLLFPRLGACAFPALAT